MIYPSDIDLMRHFPREENQYLFHYTSDIFYVRMIMSIPE